MCHLVDSAVALVTFCRFQNHLRTEAGIFTMGNTKHGTSRAHEFVRFRVNRSSYSALRWAIRRAAN